MFVRRLGIVSRRVRVVGSSALVIACLTNVGAAHEGFGLDRFDPSDRGSHWFSADSLDFRGSQRWALGVVADYAHEPLVLIDEQGNTVTAVIDDQFFVHAGLSLTLAERVRFGLNLPVLLFQDGDDVEGPTGIIRPSSDATLGDLRLSADVRLFGEQNAPFTLSAGARAYFPTGSRSAFTSDGVFSMLPQLQVAGRVKSLVYAARGGVRIRGREQNFGGEPVGSELVFGAALGVIAFDDRLVVGPELWGSSVVSDGPDAFFGQSSTAFEGILGAHFDAVKGLRVGLGFGPGVTDGMGAPAMRYLASIEWVQPTEDAPPPPPSDQDEDGITDSEDACPLEAGGPDPDPGKNGCPVAPPDTDADGILDSADACPAEAGPQNEDPKLNGCPLPADADADSIVDAEDACPKDKGVPNLDDKSKHGCPLPLDSDGDGILDAQDACPKQAGTSNADPSKNGCPKAIVTATRIEILDRVEFETAKATLTTESDAVLSAVAKILKDHPEIKKVNVEGHTDNRGPKGVNADLSRRRAAAVVQWLVANGVEASRLTSQGFGPDRPIDSNDTDAGRQNNRRVEFKIVEGTPVEGATQP